MKKKIIGIIAAIAVVLGLGLTICNQIIPNEYEPDRKSTRLNSSHL